MWRPVAVLGCLLGCGSSPPPTKPSAPVQKSTVVDPADAARAELARRGALGEAHRKLEDEQATALGATCDPNHRDPPRCVPGCYVAEPADPRAKAAVRGAVEITHLICTHAATDVGPFALADALGGAAIAVRAARGRVPSAGKRGSWQAEVEREAAVELAPELARGDVVRVTGAWRAVVDPVTQDTLRCVTVAQRARGLRHPLDACGSQGGTACEAGGNAVAHGIDVVHFRLAEARRLEAANDQEGCRAAAAEAIAIAHGMPRWRQYATLDAGTWKHFARYRTRFDGTLDEDAVFAAVDQLGADARAVSVACGGPATPPTTAAQEQSFHTCW